jgi:sterile alpha motif and leucine zipper-containing kinase AZK
MDATMQSSSVAAMNPRWLAPELLDGVPSSAETDIFSLGVVLWEILTLGVPWEGANPWVIVEKIRKGERLAYSYDPSVCSKAEFDAYESLMNKCWSSEPSKRPTASDAASSLAAML